MDEDVIQIKILDTNLTVKTGTHPDYVKKVVHYYQSKLAETEDRNPVQDPVKLSLLTGLNIIDELFKLKADRGQNGDSYSNINNEDYEELTQEMIESLSLVLQQD